MVKKNIPHPTYPIRINWASLKSWSAKIALIVGLSASLTGVFNGFVSFLAVRVSESINSDIQSVKSTVRAITDTNIPFLSSSINALSNDVSRQDVANEKKFDTINAKLDKVATKEDLQIILNAIKK